MPFPGHTHLLFEVKKNFTYPPILSKQLKQDLFKKLDIFSSNSLEKGSYQFFFKSKAILVKLRLDMLPQYSVGKLFI